LGEPESEVLATIGESSRVKKQNLKRQRKNKREEEERLRSRGVTKKKKRKRKEPGQKSKSGGDVPLGPVRIYSGKKRIK